MVAFLDGLADLFSWKAAAAAVIALVGWTVEMLVGDLYGPQARGIELVIFMMSADFIAGSWAAILTKTWTWERLRGAVGKLLLWAMLVLVAVRIVRYTTGNMPMDAAFGYVSDFLIAYLVFCDLLSVLGHAVTLAGVLHLKMPLLSRLILLLEGWQDKGILPNKVPKGADPDCTKPPTPPADSP